MAYKDLRSLIYILLSFAPVMSTSSFFCSDCCLQSSPSKGHVQAGMSRPCKQDPRGFKENLLLIFLRATVTQAVGNCPLHLHQGYLCRSYCPGTQRMRGGQCPAAHCWVWECTTWLPGLSQQEQHKLSSHSLLRVGQKSICIGWVSLQTQLQCQLALCQPLRLIMSTHPCLTGSM